MKDKLRLHHYINKNLSKLTESNFTPKEVANNIQLCGVNIDGTIYYSRLEWVFGNEDISISHWPSRAKASYEGLRVVWEDDNYLVVFKPFGLPVQPGAGHIDNNLVNWLKENIKGQKELMMVDSSENNTITAGLVHRLDKDTQGLILIAKGLKALVHAQNQFRLRTVNKSYLTIVSGTLEEQMTIEGYQYRDPKTLLKQIYIPKHRLESEIIIHKLDTARIKECKTQIIPLLTDGVRTFCIANIFTGRMHQIRLAAQSIGYPIINDKIYSNVHAKMSDIDLHNVESTELTPTLVEASKIDDIIKNVFNNHSYCLISNFISFLNMDNEEVAIRLFDY
jgi:23S rRNA-/tRNA-specific pseudouridylate synthase